MCVCVCMDKTYVQLINSCQPVRSGVAVDSDAVAASLHPSPTGFAEQHVPSPDLPTSVAAEGATLQTTDNHTPEA